ncbi:D-aminoacyl-tRNA deacylase [Teredinibacter waterburyi]|uniref:D-aminoacyl-tRNA deacylase n=1 Tax=Teredinibacter waterburyi TaxID=1500538 RepID=UPI00165F8A84|nr:D-aminoacyl-tRNA deacylase [Teredinibacter waterburyi]
MKVLIQRVKHASVSVNNQTIGAIEQGVLAFIGIEKHDSQDILLRMADKLLSYRVFADEQGKMNKSVKDINGGLLAISQFTLAADTRKGLRPSFSVAAEPVIAEGLYNLFVDLLKQKHPNIATGKFAADMQVSLLNDGPVTFLLEM